MGSVSFKGFILSLAPTGLLMLSYRVSFVPINFSEGVLFNHASHGILVNLISVIWSHLIFVITIYSLKLSNYYHTNNTSNDTVIKRAEKGEI